MSGHTSVAVVENGGTAKISVAILDARIQPSAAAHALLTVIQICHSPPFGVAILGAIVVRIGVTGSAVVQDGGAPPISIAILNTIVAAVVVANIAVVKGRVPARNAVAIVAAGLHSGITASALATIIEGCCSVFNSVAIVAEGIFAGRCVASEVGKTERTGHTNITLHATVFGA